MTPAPYLSGLLAAAAHLDDLAADAKAKGPGEGARALCLADAADSVRRLAQRAKAGRQGAFEWEGMGAK